MSFLSKIVFICYFSFEKLLEEEKKKHISQCNISINNRRYIDIVGAAVGAVIVVVIDTTHIILLVSMYASGMDFVVCCRK